MLKEIIENAVEEMLTGEAQETVKSGKPSFVGRKVLVRTYSAGVHFGTLTYKEGQNVFLKDAHRVHYWVKACSLSQLAMEGSKDISNCRISVKVDEIELDRAIEIIPITDEIFTHLTSKIWKS